MIYRLIIALARIPLLIFTLQASNSVADSIAIPEAGKKAVLDQRAQEIRHQVDQYLSEIAKKRFSGAVVIEYQGEKILSKGYGESDREKQILYSPTTISDIGSVTKQFTAAAILKLEMQGKLSVSDKLSRYFPDAPKGKANITLHQVLNMSAGLHTYSDTGGGDFEAVSEAGFLELAMGQKLLSAPGEQWEYSNTSYSLLALLIEQVSGLTYEQYLYRNLFKPAGMEQTGYSRPGFKPENVAVQHRSSQPNGKPTEKPWEGAEPYLHLKGNGGLLSTAEDLYRWHRALLGDNILSAEAKTKYFKPYLDAWEGRRNDSYAYGWFIQPTDRETTLIHHAGGNGYAFTYFFRFVDDGAAIIIVCNDNDGFNSKVIKQLRGMVFDSEFTPLPKSGYITLNELLVENYDIKHILAFIKREKEGVAPSDYDVSERGINHFAYAFVRQKKLQDALEVFELNISLFPRSADVYDSYGETLIALGQLERGVQAYQTALELDPEYENAVFALGVLEQYRDKTNGQ